MKHLSLAFMAAVALSALVGMVSLVTEAVSAPLPLALTQAVDKDTDQVEYNIVVGVYPAEDASKVEYFTFQTVFPTRKACTEFQASDEFKGALMAFLMHQSQVLGPTGFNLRCLAKGTPT